MIKAPDFSKLKIGTTIPLNEFGMWDVRNLDGTPFDF